MDWITLDNCTEETQKPFYQMNTYIYTYINIYTYGYTCMYTCIMCIHIYIYMQHIIYTVDWTSTFRGNDDMVEALAFLAQRHKKRRRNDLEAEGGCR